MVVQAYDLWWPQQGKAAGVEGGLEADRLPCSGGGQSLGCVGRPTLSTRRGVNKLFILRVNEALERAVEVSGIMPLQAFREEKARISLASSNRTSAIGVGTSGGAFPVPYKVALKLASRWRGQSQGASPAAPA
eukprot:CAMPEP_0118938144 /NCGR_PEP_ID=MMETSP1169-20130426/24890_1 /TAXON_ID=36882 /ORGANISM="Pyramimonas obovata, Strain CCMP722" /LENGTH=132 /DNA_ID=CAMNT_0006881997 /DNA_START=350 /DNA_END=745 /DNA_ORIENTATION=-